MKRPERNLAAAADLSEEVLAGVFGDASPSHDQKWEELKHDPDSSAFAREAIIKAQRLREREIDPGDAYLRGIADRNAFAAGRELAAAVNGELATLATTDPVDPR